MLFDVGQKVAPFFSPILHRQNQLMMQTKKQFPFKDSQLVFITDETGIFELFEQLKSGISQLTTHFITLIYAVNESENNHFPFQLELNILEKRYSEKFIVHKLHTDSITFYVNSLIQEFLEAIINSNLEPKLEFAIFGTDEFVNQNGDILVFLNIESINISSKIIQLK